MNQCPFCKSVLHEGAIVCVGCNAEKGYTRAKRVYGRVETILFGIVFPAMISLFIISMWIMYSSPGVIWPLAVAAIFLLPISHSAWRLSTGPVWYRFRKDWR